MKHGLRLAVLCFMVVFSYASLPGCKTPNQAELSQTVSIETAAASSEDGDTAGKDIIVGGTVWAQNPHSGRSGTYDISGEFNKKVNNNPIDRDYYRDYQECSQSPGFSTHAELQLESEYAQIWDTELNAVYNKLLSQLSPGEKKILIESQKGWLQHHEKESEFVNQTYFMRNSGSILGSQGRIQMSQAIKSRLRTRTLELMEYYALLGNNIEFVYKGK